MKVMANEEYNSNSSNKVDRRMSFKEPQSPTFTSYTGHSLVKVDINKNLKKHFDAILIEKMTELGLKKPKELSFSALY